MVGTESSNNPEPGKLVQTSLTGLEPRPPGSHHFTVDPVVRRRRSSSTAVSSPVSYPPKNRLNPLPSEVFSSLPTPDLSSFTEEQLMAACDGLSPQELRNFENGTAIPRVRIAYQTEEGEKTISHLITSVLKEVGKKQAEEKQASTQKKDRSTINKEKRLREKREYWAAIHAKARRYGERA